MLLVDTSIWSLAFRRDVRSTDARVEHLRASLVGGADVAVTGIVLQELLQGIRGPKDRDRLVERLAALPLIQPDRADHVEAATIHTTCRRAGVQLATVDALLAALCIRRDLALLTADRDFDHAARVIPLRVWSP